MKPIRVDFEMQTPNKIDRDKMWLDLKFDIIDGDFEFVELLRNHIGGILYFKGFRFYENDVFDWYCSRGRLSEIQFEEKFLLSERVLKTFQVIDGDYVEIERAWKEGELPKFDRKSESVIGGEMAELLYRGGAYGSKYKKSPKEVKEKAQEFCNTLFEGKYTPEFVRFYTSEITWNSWFIDFAIDKTYLIFCMQTRILWMLAFTDSD